MVDYKIISPKEIFRGKTYSSWVCDWLNWFLSVDADKRNSGPVVFLRSLGLPPTGKDSDGLYTMKDQSVTNTYASDWTYARSYQNRPNVRIGSDRLQIYKDQAVLVPIIVAFEVASKPYFDWGFMQDFTGSTIDNGDSPPEAEQLQVDGKSVVLPRPLKIDNFRIQTPIFTAIVPEADYGRSVKDFLEYPVEPGHYPAIAEGYFVLMTFNPGRYLVHSWASAPRETGGPYFSELVYEIEVNNRIPRISRGAPGFRSAAREGFIKQIIDKKVKIGELSRTKGNNITTNIKL